jgi:pimeloyl-ACP methyl ester carboxylesterase
LVAAPELVIGREKGYLADPEERAMALRTVRDCSRRFAVNPNRIYIAGHSMGGCMTWDVALTYPDLFAAAAPFNGCVSGTASNYLLHTFLVPFYCVGSSRDRRVRNINRLARQELLKHTTRERLRRNPPMKYVEYHKRSSSGFLEEIPNVTAWLDGKSRERYPRNVEFASADAETTRVHWLEMLLHRVRKPRTTAQATLRRLKPSLHASGTSTLAGEIRDGNLVRVRARKTRSVRIYASRRLFDLRRPLRVSVNGKPTRVLELEPSRARLLEITRLIGDRERHYWCSVDLPVPK